jgi:hypothetical protein
MVGLIIWKHLLIEHVNEMISMVIPFAIEPHGLQDMVIPIDKSRFEQLL